MLPATLGKHLTLDVATLATALKLRGKGKHPVTLTAVLRRAAKLKWVKLDEQIQANADGTVKKYKRLQCEWLGKPMVGEPGSDDDVDDQHVLDALESPRLRLRIMTSDDCCMHTVLCVCVNVCECLCGFVC